MTDRREFVKASVAALVGTALIPSLSPGSKVGHLEWEGDKAFVWLRVPHHVSRGSLVMWENGIVGVSTEQASRYTLARVQVYGMYDSALLPGVP